MAKSKNDMKKENGQVITGEDGKQYFVCGKNYIEISEHFAQNGKPLSDLIEDVILYTADQRISA